jgi:hypothetical protein
MQCEQKHISEHPGTKTHVIRSAAEPGQDSGAFFNPMDPDLGWFFPIPNPAHFL